MSLKTAITPSKLKIGFFGKTGSGKTYTAAKILSQFVAKYCPEKQIAMFDTEPAAGYVAPMVKEITGKDLLVETSRSFSDLMAFVSECEKHGYVAWVDSITHPWRSLMNDYLDAKKSRVKGAGGNVQTVRLSLKDWGPIKDMWAQFTEKYVFNDLHFCIAGREGDTWETVTDEEGNDELRKTGAKMKTEVECGHEPSLLVQMKTINSGHYAFVEKDRFHHLTCKTSDNNPDIEFFMPHINMLDLKGHTVRKSEGKPVFEKGSGPNWETIKKRREAVLENIKDDLLLAYPGQSADMKKAKVEILRVAFGTSSWSELESDHNKFPLEDLNRGRDTMNELIEQDSKKTSKKEKK